jgi:two-component system, LytTR family, sensor kinase
MTAPSRVDASPSLFVRRARIALVVLAAWLGFSAVQLSIAAAVSQGGEIKWSRELFVDLTMAVYWWVATAPIARWHRHLRRAGRSGVPLLVMHLPLLMLVTAGDTLTTRLSLRLFMGMFPSAPFIATLTYFADFDVLSYLAVVIVTDAVLTLAVVRVEEARAVRLESLLGRARLEYLEAQLQPHFLFNALGAVSELAYEAPASALRVLRQLALIFRSALTARAGEVTLGEELVAIEPYLDIQRLRFPDWLRIDYDIGGDALDCLVPRFVLQPLVENAIRHGLTGREAAGCIEISARVSGDRLLLRVEDNGVGLRRSGGRAGYGIGLTNVRERLTTLYGAGDQLRLSDAQSGGAIAELTVPLRRITESTTTDAQTTPLEEAGEGPSEPVAGHSLDDVAASIPRRTVRALTIWIVCGLLWTLQSYAYLRIRDRLGQYTFWTLAEHDVAAALLWALIAPLVFLATSRFPLTRERLIPRAMAYLIAVALVAVGHVAIVSALFRPKVRLWSSYNTNSFVLNLLILGVLVGLGHRRQLGEWMRQRTRAAAALSAELRTARRRATRMQEIPPVVLSALDRVIAAVADDPSPHRTEQLLARLGDYLRVAIECSDEEGITASREQSLARSLGQFERVARLAPASHPNPITSS